MKKLVLLFTRLTRRDPRGDDIIISETRLKQLRASPWATDKEVNMKWQWPKGWLTKRREELKR
jgi:hypothetical protein